MAQNKTYVKHEPKWIQAGSGDWTEDPVIGSPVHYH